jgi:hypothetical protein
VGWSCITWNVPAYTCTIFCPHHQQQLHLCDRVITTTTTTAIVIAYSRQGKAFLAPCRRFLVCSVT